MISDKENTMGVKSDNESKQTSNKDMLERLAVSAGCLAVIALMYFVLM